MSYIQRVKAVDLLGHKVLGRLHADGSLELADWAYRTPLDRKNVAAEVLDVVHLDGPDVVDPINPVDSDHPDHTLRIRVMVGDRKWSFTAHPDATLRPLPKHHETCGECGEVWPCTDKRIDSAAFQMTHALDDQCNHCGEQIGGAWSKGWTEDGVRRKYHIAKKYRANGVRCVDACTAAWSAHLERTRTGSAS